MAEKYSEGYGGSIRCLMRSSAGSIIEKSWLGRVEGLQYVPVNGPMVVIANHCSYLDPVILTWLFEGRAKRRIHFIANMKVVRHPVFRLFTTCFESIPVDLERFGKGFFRTALNYIEEGRVVGLFPEGTRSSSGKLLPFKPGYLRLAARAGATVLPVQLHGTFDILPPHRWWPRMNRRCDITIHSPLSIPAGTYSKTEINEFNRKIYEKYYAGSSS